MDLVTITKSGLLNLANFCLFWSTNPRLSKNAGRLVDYKVLTPLPRSDDKSSVLIFSLFNVQSLSNKSSLIHEINVDRNIDFRCLTESWQKPNDFLYLNQTTPSGYTYTCKPCCFGKGDGLALINHDNYILYMLIMYTILIDTVIY